MITHITERETALTNTLRTTTEALNHVTKERDALRAELARIEKKEPITYGVDWGSHGDRSCVSIVKHCADGTLEVVATGLSPEPGALS